MQTPTLQEFLDSYILNEFLRSKDGPWIPEIPPLPPTNNDNETRKVLFTVDHALLGTKNYHLHKILFAEAPSDDSKVKIIRASLDFAFLYDNIDYAEPMARQVVESCIEIWNFETALAKKTQLQPGSSGQTN